jgi:8-oxo-dGTP pyrophosphatase MutT (NUDIX family)
MSKTIFTSPGGWIEIREATDGRFFFSRRRNKDSVAVILYRYSPDEEIEVLIRQQPLVHRNDGDSLELFSCPITGGFEEGLDHYELALKEIEEEAGYSLSVDQITYLGSYVATTQSDEEVFMFCANVTGLPNVSPLGDGSFHESISRNVWRPFESMLHSEYAGTLILYLKMRPLLQ